MNDRTLLGAVLALVAAVPPAVAQAPAADPPGAGTRFAALTVGAAADPATAVLSVASLQAFDETSRGDTRTRTVLGASTLVLAGPAPAAPLTELALLQGGDRIGCWTLVNTDLARPVPPVFLARFGVQTPLPSVTHGVLEHDALAYVLLLATKNSPEAFRASAAANRRVTYAMLYEDPLAHRGQVVHVEGEARWVRKLETPGLLKEAGVADLYEVWVVNAAVGPRPYSVLLTELPPDLALGKPISVPVALDGYFLKRRREATDDAVPHKAWRESVLIAGRSLTVETVKKVTVTAQGRATLGAATLLLGGASPAGDAPLTELALLRAGEPAGCWTLVNSDVVRPIRPETLAKIKDGKTLPSAASDGQEFDALLEVLTQTWYTSPRAFEKAARHDLGFRQLFENPEKYRGEVVHVEGRLRLVQRWEPPLMAREAGVPLMYEAAIFDAASGDNPYIVFVMEAPEGVPLEQKVNEPATFDGYFYKKWRYKALDSTKPTEYREAPLLIGRSLKVQKGAAATPPEEVLGWTTLLGVSLVAVLSVAVVVMFALAFWLRRGDARVHDKLHAVRTGANPFAPPPGDGPPANGSQTS
jgi:hypothetical protein